MKPRRWLNWVYAVLAVNAVGNGLWMLAAPAHWFATVPGAADTGPLNQHLVRDFGNCFLLVGAAIVYALVTGRMTRTLHWFVTSFLALHASVHAWEFAVGRQHAHQLVVDLPGVYLPVVLLLVLGLPFAWQQANEQSQEIA